MDDGCRRTAAKAQCDVRLKSPDIGGQLLPPSTHGTGPPFKSARFQLSRNFSCSETMLAHVVFAFFEGATGVKMKHRHGFTPPHGRRKYRDLARLQPILSAYHRAGRQAAFRYLDSIPIILNEFDESSVFLFFHFRAPLVGFLAHTAFSVVILDALF